MKNKIIFATLLFVFIILCKICFFNETKEVKIDIGYQSVTSQTWGALIIKNKKIFEEKLQQNYSDKKVKVVWHDEISGAIINTNMISGKMQFGFMGDMPLILNAYKAETLKNYDSKIIALDGKGDDGKNQSVLVSKNSNINSIKELKGKTISTPIGSSAHYMLMKALQKYDMLNDVTITHQDVSLSSQLLSTNKTDAFSIWEPYPTLLSNEGSGEILFSGEETGVDYLAGVIVNNNYAKENEKIVTLFIESLEEAHKFIIDNPEESAIIFSEESGFDINITKKLLETITWKTNIEDSDISTLIDKQKFLIDIDQIKEFDLNKYIYKTGD